jgi:hypothetical protein
MNIILGTCRPLAKAKLQQLVTDARGQRLSHKTRQDYDIVINVFNVRVRRGVGRPLLHAHMQCKSASLLCLFTDLHVVSSTPCTDCNPVN